MGITNGLVLASVPFLLSYINVHNNIIIWIVLIILSYLLSFALNTIIQLINCGTLYPISIAKNSTWIPVFVAIFLGLSNIGFLSWAVEGILPDMGNFNKQAISRGFYIFWGAMYGQLISGGLVQSCV